MDYVPQLKKFMVLKRYEVPRAEYSYDVAVQKVIEINEIYNPSWIYCDAGAAEYQLERLHIYGDEHPETGLKHKVVRRNFRQSLDIIDPITQEVDKKPLKLFMVTQLQIAFERDLIILSPFDEVLHKQLIDYEVEKFTGATHDPVFTSKNEHFVDALGLAYLAFVREFNELIDMVREIKLETVIEASSSSFAKKSLASIHKRTANQSAWQNEKNQRVLKGGICDPFGDEPHSKVLIPVTAQESLQERQRRFDGRASRTRRNSVRRSW